MKTEEEIKTWLLTHAGVESEYNRNLIYNTFCNKSALSDKQIFEWLQSKKFQTERGDQEYKMYFDVDMPKIIRLAIQELTP